MSASNSVTGNLAAPDKAELSEREHEILRLVATGLSNKEIAAQLTISPNTVKVHLRNIFAKIEVASRTEATVYAIQHGFVQVPGQAAANSAALPAEAAPPPAEDWKQVARRYWWAPILALVVAVVVGAWLGPRIMAPASAPAEAAVAPRWEPRAAQPTPRTGLAVATYNDLIYAIGGEAGQEVSGVVERYDAEADAWESGLADKPTPTADVSAAVIGGRIFVPGGRLTDGTMTAVMEVYDPRRDAWEPRAPLPVALSAYALAAFEGKLYLFGGWDGTAYLSTVYEYDPDSDAWAERSALPTARGFAGAAAAGGSIFVVGGRDDTGALAANEEYSPEAEAAGAEAWQARAALPSARYGAGVASVADIIHVVGGAGAASPLLSLKYFVARDAWETFELPAGGDGPGLALGVVGADIHTLGGPHAAYRAIYTVVLPIVQ